jgi:hypothetical protein
VRSDDLRSEARWPRYAPQLCNSERLVVCRSSCNRRPHGRRSEFVWFPG